jgi:serine-type D-Ala-D-Ala carboxypeptidase/endopeptidase (penicillin-binding protein 4)
MNKVCWFVIFMLCCGALHAQTIEQKLLTAVQQLETDSQMRHAILGFTVADAKTGRIIFERNSQVGLAPASTQKIFSSAASFELLGKDYRYKTELGYDGEVQESVLWGTLFVRGYGDPTFGSWRYEATKPETIKKQFVDVLLKNNIRALGNYVFIDDSRFDVHSIPDGWIWQDIGNYYGASGGAVNWRENQYDLLLEAGDSRGDSVRIKSNGMEALEIPALINELKTAAKGSGDNAYIYLTPLGGFGYLRGTIPAGEKNFKISGSMPFPAVHFGLELESWLPRPKGLKNGRVMAAIHNAFSGAKFQYDNSKIIYTHYSPTLDSINYYFMRRSINMYGEALIKTISYEKTGFGSTDTGVRIVRDFWASKGIDKAAINIIDGSGLSPQNRVTADALVKVLLYAKSRAWFASFYESVPTFNGMKLKSGSIGGARAFAGYHTSSDGKEYVTAILVNNYAGSSGEIVKKMYKVLDVLK